MPHRRLFAQVIMTALNRRAVPMLKVSIQVPLAAIEGVVRVSAQGLRIGLAIAVFMGNRVARVDPIRVYIHSCRKVWGWARQSTHDK